MKDTVKRLAWEKEYRRKNRNRISSYHKKWYSNPLNRKRKKEYAKRRNFKLKLDVITHYGGKCACCKETSIEFLEIDHIKGGGNKHRRETGLKTGVMFYKYLIDNNYPSGYRVLCSNCNRAYGNYGYCPHKRRGAA